MRETCNSEWVMKRRNHNHGLAPLKEVLKKHGNPERGLPVIHVAGTNGKGSVCCYLKDMLVCHGHKVGFFTSPHLISHYDRIRINDAWIDENTYNSYLNQYLDDILAYDLGMFEITVLIAVTFFKDQKVDYAIMECGLGGRLDSTNVLDNPLVSVITTIGSDHGAILGTREEQIAFEKAGIIRNRVPVCVGYVNKKAETVIRLAAERKKAPVTFLSKYRSLSEDTIEIENDIYVLHGNTQYQKDNAALALHVAKYLGLDIHDKITHESLSKTKWAGRFEKMEEKPAVYLDGAHNKEGVQALLRNYPYLKRPVVTVFSSLGDKPGRIMAGMLKEKSDVLIITSIANERFISMDSMAITDCMKIENEMDAVMSAKKIAGENGTVVICGSLYFISDIRKRLKDERTLYVTERVFSDW